MWACREVARGEKHEAVGADAVSPSAPARARYRRAARTMTVADERTYALPDAMPIVGVLWDSLGLTLPRNREQTARKMLRGKRDADADTRTAVLRALLCEVAAAGYVQEDAVNEIASALVDAIGYWDRFVGRRRTMGYPSHRADIHRLMRLAAIDLALRVAAYDRLFGSEGDVEDSPPMVHEVPRWAHEHGVRTWLRDLLRSRNGSLSDKTVDDWFYRGARPTMQSIEQVVVELPRDGSIDDWQTTLAWALALEALCNKLAVLVGRAAVEDIALMFCRLRRTVGWLIAPVPLDTVTGLLRAGAHGVEGRVVIDLLATPTWLRILGGGPLDKGSMRLGNELRLCRGDWVYIALFPGVHEVVELEGAPPEVHRRIVDAGMSNDPDELARAVFSHPVSAMWALRALVQRAAIDGSFELAAPAVANVADALRVDALQLDAVLLYLFAGDLGEVRRRLPMLEASWRELLGNILAAVDGEPERAIPFFRAVAAADPSRRFCVADLLADVGDHAEALALARDILRDEPRHAYALATAARSAWQLGQARAGNAYAKAAAKFGVRVERPARRHRVGRETSAALQGRRRPRPAT